MSEQAAEALKYAAVAPEGRALVVVELLRMGHSAWAVSQALRCANRGDLDGALAILAGRAAGGSGTPTEGTDK